MSSPEEEALLRAREVADVLEAAGFPEDVVGAVRQPNAYRRQAEEWLERTPPNVDEVIARIIRRLGTLEIPGSFGWLVRMIPRSPSSQTLALWLLEVDEVARTSPRSASVLLSSFSETRRAGNLERLVEYLQVDWVRPITRLHIAGRLIATGHPAADHALVEDALDRAASDPAGLNDDALGRFVEVCRRQQFYSKRLEEIVVALPASVRTRWAQRRIDKWILESGSSRGTLEC